MRSGFAVAVLLLAPGSPALAQASPVQQADQQDLINPDRPGIADGSKVIGAARFQLETGVQREYRRDGESRTHTTFVPTLLRVGLSDKWEARVEGNTFTRLRQIPVGMPPSTTSGFAPISVGAKYGLFDPKEGSAPSLGIIGRAFPAAGTEEFKTEHFTGDVRLTADWGLGPKFSLNPNVGAARYESSGVTFAAALFAMTLNYQPTDTLNPFVDLGYQSATERGGEAFVAADAGLAWIVGRNIQLDVSVGQGLHGDAPRPFISAGISIRTGRGTHVRD